MRELIVFASAFFLTIIAVSAANIYVRPGATGSGDGRDWINAYPSLPTNWVRGNIYYIADGTYGGAIFNTPPSGATLITVKKATISDHGTNTGWKNSYGDGKALFTDTLNFTSSYWLFDGQTGGGVGSWTTGFGFHVVCGLSRGTNVYKAPDVNFITIKHTELEGNYGDGDASGNANDGVWLGRGNNVVISYCYIHDMGRCLFFGAADFVTIENCYGGAFESTPNEHSEIASIWDNDGDGIKPHNWTVRNSIWTHLNGTGGFMMDGSALEIDSCVFSQLNKSSGGNGALGTWGNSRLIGLKVTNSAFLNLKMPAVGVLNSNDTGTFFNNVVSNSYIGTHSGFNRLTHDFNHYNAVIDNAPVEVHPVVGSSGPFDFGLSESGLGNISTRGFVGTKNDVLIAGFIVTNPGDNSKCRLVIRAIGPSLKQNNISTPLPNPTLELFDDAGRVIARNDNWQQNPDSLLIRDLGFAPASPWESALLEELPPGRYTVVIRGLHNTTGIALAEVYNLGSDGDAKLANVSSRAQVKLGDQVMIGGLIIKGDFSHKIIARAIGPSLASAGLTNALADPTLELINGQGNPITFNDNWKDSQRLPIEATGIPPTQPSESAIVRTLPPGNYTLIVRGKNNATGVALVEAYAVD